MGFGFSYMMKIQIRFHKIAAFFCIWQMSLFSNHNISGLFLFECRVEFASLLM